MVRDGVCSKETASFLMESWQGSTQKPYNFYLRKWHLFCDKKGFDIFQGTEMQVCEFLRELSEAGYAYGSVNAARCALSAISPKVHGVYTVGKSYWVTRAARAAYLRKPPTPKYTRFWDVRLVLKTIKLWGRNKNLSLKYLGFKVLVLLLLVTGQRSQVALMLRLDRMSEYDDGSVGFVLTKPLKTAKTGDKLVELKLQPYNTQSKLCVIRALKQYLERTRDLRKSKFLFVSFRKKHEAVSKGTIARWIAHVLRVSGVNIGKYGPHSLRGAGVSAGTRLGVNTDVLLKYGSWRNMSTMARHYQKEVEVLPDENLGRVLLDEVAHA